MALDPNIEAGLGPQKLQLVMDIDDGRGVSAHVEWPAGDFSDRDHAVDRCSDCDRDGFDHRAGT
jgi:hypothetical protein